jgi:hypothetical protein
MDASLDLLGDPIPEGFGRRGRPAHIPTVENRNKIRMLLAFDWGVPRIARALRITPPTLRKHYFRELRHADEARDALEGELVKTTLERANAGDASMMRLALKMFEKHELSRLAGRVIDAASQPTRPPKLGKKEQAMFDARTPDQATPMGELMAMRQGDTGKPN